VVRALFPRSNLSVLSRGRFGGGPNPVLRDSPLPATRSAARMTRVHRVRRGMHILTQSEGRVSVPSPLAHPLTIPRLPAGDELIFHVIM
jgi:hypothetical protein